MTGALLIHVAIVLIVIGVIMWLINAYIPMFGPIKSILNLVVIVLVILWLLSVFGIYHGFDSILSRFNLK